MKRCSAGSLIAHLPAISFDSLRKVSYQELMLQLSWLLFVISFLIPYDAEAVTHAPSPEDIIVRAILIRLTDAPKDQETCFSPDQACDIKLLKFLQSAHISIDVAIYDINLPEIVDELVRQSKLIPVRIIVDKRQSKGKRSLVPYMISQGLNVRYGRQKGILHDKFTIIDDKMIEEGSFNYTKHASQANQENQLFSATSSVVNHYRRQFDKMWEASTVPAHTKT